jgi:hypothetical protein
MLVFIIPVKSPKIATSWLVLSQLFERSLRSICNQTSQEFRVIVVCNEKPETQFHHPYVRYLEVDFPVPYPDYTAKMDDRAKKVVAGLVAARELQPNHVMFVDADDCISRRIAAFVAENPESHGWFVDRGYEYVDGSTRISLRRKSFYKMCGTCNIFNYQLLAVPEKLLPYEHISGYDRFLTGHPLARGDLAARGTPMQHLPFPGAIYIRDTIGESITLQEPLLHKLKRNPKEALHTLKRTVLAPVNDQDLTQDIREEFGLYAIHDRAIARSIA